VELFFKWIKQHLRNKQFYGTLPLHFDVAGALVVTLELDGKRVEAGLLSGDPVSTIDANATRQFFGFDETSAGVEVVQSEGGNPRRPFYAMSIALSFPMQAYASIVLPSILAPICFRHRGLPVQ
jgi:hypothetical protein